MNPTTSKKLPARKRLGALFVLLQVVLMILRTEAGERVPVPELISIPASEVTLGPAADLPPEVLPLRQSERRSVRIPAYKIGRYEVANIEYAAFLQDGGYENRSFWSDEGWVAKKGHGWQCPEVWFDRRYMSEEKSDHPVVGVSWYEARAYCRWLSAKTGRRFNLPTEDQWEYAAGGPDGLAWPWGNQWDPKRCNWGDDTDGNRQGDGGIDGFRFPAPVVTYPNGVSPFGCFDMAGNAREWCLDRYSTEGDRRAYRVLRGGSWMTVSPQNLTTFFRGGTQPWVRFVFWGTIGFRVVETLGEMEQES